MPKVIHRMMTESIQVIYFPFCLIFPYPPPEGRCWILQYRGRNFKYERENGYLMEPGPWDRGGRSDAEEMERLALVQRKDI